MNLLRSIVLLSLTAIAGPNTALAGLPEDGQWDTQFGNAGVQRFGFDLVQGARDSAGAMAIASSGRIHVAGQVQTADGQGGFYWQVGLARLMPNGALDTGFSGDGKTISTPLSLAGHNHIVTDLIVRADGKPIVAGQAIPPNNVLSGKSTICRYNVAGNLDLTFDGDGCAQPDPGFLVDGFHRAEAIAEMPEQSVLVVGYASKVLFILVDTVGFALLLDSAGQIDPGFGVLTLNPPGAGEVSVSDVVRVGDGRVYAIGSSDLGPWVARFFESGTIDAAFGVQGYAHFDFDDLHQQIGQDFMRAVALDPQGRVYACGSTRLGNIYQDVMAIARITPEGSLDTSYSGDGRILQPFVDVFSFSTIRDCAIDQRGRLVAGMHTGVTGPVSGDFAVVRFDENGVNDASFNLAGGVRVGIDAGGQQGLGHERVAAIALQGADILVAGTASPLNGDGATDPSDLAVIRIRSDQLLVDGFE